MNNPKSPNKPEGANKRVLLADESPATLRQLRQALQELASIEIVGEARDTEEALDLFLKGEVDAVVASVCLPVYGGFHLLRSIKRAAADCAVILTTRRCNPYVEEAAKLLGADGVCPVINGFAQLRAILERL
jgi:DNA-binding NarL/FixJ family response regulator